MVIFNSYVKLPEGDHSFPDEFLFKPPGVFFDALQSPKTWLNFLQTTLLSDTMNLKLAM